MKWNKLTAFVSFTLLFWACSESDNVSGENRIASGIMSGDSEHGRFNVRCVKD